MIFLLSQALPLLREVPLTAFLFSTEWYPTDEPPVFGLGAMITGSFAVAVLTTIFAVPVGVLTAAALHCAVPPAATRFLKPVIELMAALPSVVIGFIGMLNNSPLKREGFDQIKTLLACGCPQTCRHPDHETLFDAVLVRSRVLRRAAGIA